MTDCGHKRKKKKHFNPFTARQILFFNTNNFLDAIFVLSQVRYFYSCTLGVLREREKTEGKGETHILYHFHKSNNGYFNSFVSCNMGRQSISFLY